MNPKYRPGQVVEVAEFTEITQGSMKPVPGSATYFAEIVRIHDFEDEDPEPGESVCYVAKFVDEQGLPTTYLKAGVYPISEGFIFEESILRVKRDVV